MADRVSRHIEALESFLRERDWSIADQRDIEHGRQVIVTDGSARVPINFFNTGSIVVQGRPCEMKHALTEWTKHIRESGPGSPAAIGQPALTNSSVTYHVSPRDIERIRQLILELPGTAIEKAVKGTGEVYRVEAHHHGHRVTITAYKSGALLLQGLAGAYFDTVRDTLDEHLAEPFVQHATRLVVGETERRTVSSYLNKSEAEDEARQWVLEQMDQDVVDFMYDNDRRTLLAAAGVRNAFANTGVQLPDYSVVVMPFAKTYEGFLRKLAVHLGLITEESLQEKSKEIEIGKWIDAIQRRLPDAKRYGDIAVALRNAWQCRHKSIHSDFHHPFGILQTISDADQEIASILRAMKRAHHVFVREGIRLKPERDAEPAVGFRMADRQKREPIATRTSTASLARIGVDESGKGDVFGPLVIAGVVVTEETETELFEHGVRDSKQLSNDKVRRLAHLIKRKYPFEVLVLDPPEYNTAYEEHGRNLNSLLAWGHARVICDLTRRESVDKAVSDQFGDESLLIRALEAEDCQIYVEQRTHAENSDVAVAAASVIARAEFLDAMEKYARRYRMAIPRGASSSDIKKTGKIIYRRWGLSGLREIAKMHFRPVQEILSEVEK